MKSKYTPKPEQQMRNEINSVIKRLTTLMHWHREMATEDNRPIFNTIADDLYNCIEKLNRV